MHGSFQNTLVLDEPDIACAKDRVLIAGYRLSIYGWWYAVRIRVGFRLPTLSARSDGDAKCDVIEAGQPSPYDHVAGRRIVLASEIATEHGDL